MNIMAHKHTIAEALIKQHMEHKAAIDARQSRCESSLVAWLLIARNVIMIDVLSNRFIATITVWKHVFVRRTLVFVLFDPLIHRSYCSIQATEKFGEKLISEQHFASDQVRLIMIQPLDILWLLCRLRRDYSLCERCETLYEIQCRIHALRS